MSFFTLSLFLLRFTFPVFILFVHFALYFASGSNEKLKKESKTGMCCYTYSLISLFHFNHSLFKLMMLTFTQFLKLLRRPWGPTITRNFVPILFTFEKGKLILIRYSYHFEHTRFLVIVTNISTK